MARKGRYNSINGSDNMSVNITYQEIGREYKVNSRFYARCQEKDEENNRSGDFDGIGKISGNKMYVNTNSCSRFVFDIGEKYDSNEHMYLPFLRVSSNINQNQHIPWSNTRSIDELILEAWNDPRFCNKDIGYINKNFINLFSDSVFEVSIGN